MVPRSSRLPPLQRSLLATEHVAQTPIQSALAVHAVPARVLVEVPHREEVPQIEALALQAGLRHHRGVGVEVDRGVPQEHFARALGQRAALQLHDERHEAQRLRAQVSERKAREPQVVDADRAGEHRVLHRARACSVAARSDLPAECRSAGSRRRARARSPRARRARSSCRSRCGRSRASTLLPNSARMSSKRTELSCTPKVPVSRARGTPSMCFLAGSCTERSKISKFFVSALSLPLSIGGVERALEVLDQHPVHVQVDDGLRGDVDVPHQAGEGQVRRQGAPNGERQVRRQQIE